MSSSPNRAVNPPGKPKRKDVSFDYVTAKRMLPLIRSIVTDIVAAHRSLNVLAPERDLLDDSRKALSWANRQRRYAVVDEIVNVEKSLTAAIAELDALGPNLADGSSGVVDFPTRINGRQAAFSWQKDENDLAFWHYAGEALRRPIPADWQPTSAVRSRRES